MKVQVLADFIIECTWLNDKPEEASTKNPNEQPDPATTWILHVDGALNFLGSEAKLILENSDGVVAEYTLLVTFKETNN